MTAALFDGSLGIRPQGSQLSDALRGGRLGVMDYYNMKNLVADTEMRSSISGMGGATMQKPVGAGDDA